MWACAGVVQSEHLPFPAFESTNQIQTEPYSHKTPVLARPVAITAVLLLIKVCWYVTQCRPVKSCRRFERPCAMEILPARFVYTGAYV